MDERQQREAMDEMHGPGAYDRMRALVLAEDRDVRELGDRIGYGRLMQAAEKIWGEKQPGLQHSVGPGASLLVKCPCRENGPANNCDWCCGCGRVTERVKQAMELEKRLSFLDSDLNQNRRADLVLALRVAPSMTVEECLRMVSRQHHGP